MLNSIDYITNHEHHCPLSASSQHSYALSFIYELAAQPKKLLIVVLYDQIIMHCLRNTIFRAPSFVLIEIPERILLAGRRNV